MTMSGVRFEVKLGPISTWFAKYVRHGPCTFQDSWNSWIAYQYLYHVPWTHFDTQERVDIPSLTWKPRTMDKSRTCPGHGKDLSRTLYDLGLLFLECGHCLRKTVGQFKILLPQSYFLNVKFHKWWSNNQQMQCTQSCALSFETILNIPDKDLHS